MFDRGEEKNRYSLVDRIILLEIALLSRKNVNMNVLKEWDGEWTDEREEEEHGLEWFVQRLVHLGW